MNEATSVGGIALAGKYETVTVTEIDGGKIVRLTFDTQTRGNVITPKLLEEMHDALTEIERKAPRVLVLKGTDKSFSRGAAIDDIRDMGDPFRDYIASEFRLFKRIDELPFVTIAALTGIVIGNAAELSLACDFRIATDTSSFSLPEVAIGFVAPAQRLCRYVGIGRAKEILLGAKMLSAAEALELGILTRTVAEADLEATVQAWAAEYADKPPIAIRVTKEGIAEAFDFSGADYLKEEEAAFMTYRTADVREGFAALAEKRKPVFTGK